MHDRILFITIGVVIGFVTANAIIVRELNAEARVCERANNVYACERVYIPLEERK